MRGRFIRHYTLPSFPFLHQVEIIGAFMMTIESAILSKARYPDPKGTPHALGRARGRRLDYGLDEASEILSFCSVYRTLLYYGPAICSLNFDEPFILID